MATIYLNAGYDGTLYETSKTPKEGFETHTSPKDGKISYRKIYKKGFYGIFKSMELRPETPIGPQLSVHLIDSANNTVYLQVHFKDQKGDIGTFAESLIAKLPYMEAELLYRFYAYNIQEEGSTYSKVGISIKHADTWESVVEEPKVGQLSYTYTRKEDGVLVPGNIPAIVWKDTFDGKKTADKTDKNNYLYGILKDYGKIQEVSAVAKPAVAATTPPAPQVSVVTPPPPPAPKQQVAAVVQSAGAPATTVTAPPPPPKSTPAAVPPPPPPTNKKAATTNNSVYVPPPTNTGKKAVDDLPF